MAENVRRRVLVVGSLNADLTVRTRRLPAPGETVTGSDLVVSPGGKSSNQAVAAALLGADVALLGRVGDDANGAFLLERAGAAGVDTSYVQRLEAVASGTAVITVDDRGENSIIVSPGANGRLTAADVQAAPGFFAAGSVLCLCLEVALPAVRAAAEAGAKAGIRVILNPSPFADVGADLLRVVDVLVVNRHELADLVGADVVGEGDEPAWDRVADALAGLGPEHVLVTLGAAGAAVVSVGAGVQHDVQRVPATVVDAVDTTGSGDAFLGSLAYRLALGDDPTTACRFAVHVGAFAATRPGAQSSYPTAVELDAFVRGRRTGTA
ncbi:MAG: ribokinase [Actinomycetes bacterium]